MAIAPIIVQRRYRELGRLRPGEKGEKGQPVKRDTWRLTSPSQSLLEAAAEQFGGTVREWEGAPTQGTQWELATTTSEIPVLVPPQDLEGSQYFELWSGGGVQRRCDGITELISGRGCLCDEDNRECQVTTHLQVMLPQLPDVGVWRLTTHGMNAAAELPGTVALLEQIRRSGQMPGAHLVIEARTSKRDGKTRHFVVPVLRLPQSLLQLGAATTEGGIPMLSAPEPSNVVPLRPAELPGRPELPADPSFTGPAFEPAAPVGPGPEFAGVMHDWEDLGDVLIEDVNPRANVSELRSRLEDLFALMGRVGLWTAGPSGASPLTAALRKHGVEDLDALNKGPLVSLSQSAWEAARKKYAEAVQP